jgi:hypothetical protein
MSDFYDSIDKVNTQKHLWCIVGCIVRKWTVNEVNCQHPERPIELIIMDSKVYIHVSMLLFWIFFQLIYTVIYYVY